MTQSTWILAGLMLQHISEILENYPIAPGNYCYGQRVLCCEDRGNYDIITVGIIRGFEYFNDESHYDVGFFYQIAVESGQAVFRDGTVRDAVTDVIERVRADDVYPIDFTLPPLKLKTVA
jgi:hypothetical protein